MSDHQSCSSMPDREAVRDKLFALIRLVPGQHDLPTLSEETRISDLGMDSLKLVEIVFEMERHFNMAADEGGMMQAQTVAQLIELFCTPATEPVVGE